MTDPNLWNQLLIWPIVNLLVFFYKLFEWVHIPGTLGFAVIAMTIAMRLLLYPLTRAQLLSARKMSKLKPHMDELSRKHKDDKAALSQAQLALYKEHGVNPAGGCLPLLIQLPVMIALYNVFAHVLGNGNTAQVLGDLNSIVYSPILKINALDLNFFGANLGIKPSEWQTQGWWLLSIPVITGLLQWWQTRLMQPAISNPTNPTNKPNEKQTQDTAAEMQKQMAIMTPLMFGFFAFQFPLGLSLYWNVFGLFGIMQQIKINKSDQ